MIARLIEFARVTDPRGRLIVAQIGDGLPFEARRFFTMFEAGWGVERGGHAHRHQSQLLVCFGGRVTVIADVGEDPQKFVLDSEERGLFVPPLNWLQLRMDRGAFLLVLCDAEYDESDYIRNRAEFDAMTRVAA